MLQLCTKFEVRRPSNSADNDALPLSALVGRVTLVFDLLTKGQCRDVTWCVWQVSPCWPIGRERKVQETPKLVGRLLTPHAIIRTCFKVELGRGTRQTEDTSAHFIMPPFLRGRGIIIIFLLIMIYTSLRLTSMRTKSTWMSSATTCNDFFQCHLVTKCSILRKNT